MDNKEIRERNEKVKQWLWRYRDAKKDVNRYEMELRELTELQSGPKAIQYSDMPKRSGNQSDLSDYMIKQENVWKKIHKARYKRIVAFQDIKNAIERLPTADEREVMSCRYLQLNNLKEKSWEEICILTNHEWAQVHRIHARALKNIHINENDIE